MEITQANAVGITQDDAAKRLADETQCRTIVANRRILDLTLNVRDLR